MADRVLLVDDDLPLRLAIADSLREAGMDVWQTGDGTVAARSVISCAPDLVLLDLELPGQDGFQVYREIRATDAGRDVPVIIVSGKRTDSRAAVEALAAGAIDFLRKPFGIDELVARVGVALKGRKLQAELERLGITDPLTALSNRRAFFVALERERRRAERNGTPLTLAILDLDHFKNVNDSYGHLAGDRVLTGVAKLLRELCRVTDVVARIGGEEFGLILSATDEEGGRALAEKLRLAIGSLSIEVAPSVSVRITASLGLATALGPELALPERATELLGRADSALYEAKRTGRDRVVQQALRPQAPLIQ